MCLPRKLKSFWISFSCHFLLLSCNLCLDQVRRSCPRVSCFSNVGSEFISNVSFEFLSLVRGFMMIMKRNQNGRGINENSHGPRHINTQRYMQINGNCHLVLLLKWVLGSTVGRAKTKSLYPYGYGTHPNHQSLSLFENNSRYDNLEKDLTRSHCRALCK